LTDNLLNKPPFRFLHDIVTEVTRATGFAEKLYSADELDSANIKDKESKISYLNKIIDAVSIACNAPVPAKPLKIVAGLNPEDTNVFLQMLAQACQLPKDQQNAAVEKALGKAGGAPAAAAPPPAAAAPPAAKPAPKPAPKPPVEDVTPPPAPVSRPSPPPQPAPAQPSPPSAPSVPAEKATPKTAPVPKAAPPPAEEPPAPPAEKPKPAPVPLAEEKPSAFPAKLDDERPLPARSSSKQPPNLEEQPLPAPKERPPSRTTSRTSSRTGGTAFVVGLDDDKPEKPEKPEKPTREHKEPKEQPEVPPFSLPKEPAGDDGPLVRPGTASRNLERPQTARRPPPKLPSNVVPVERPKDPAKVPAAKDIAIVASAAGVISETDKAADDEDDNMIVQQATVAPASGASLVNTAEQGQLAQKLFKANKELEEKRKEQEAKQTQSQQQEPGTGIVLRRKKDDKTDKATYGNEVLRLRESIQQLCQNTNPLGKCMDYVQEDLDNMAKELETWKTMRANLNAKLDDELKQTEDILRPIYTQLSDLDLALKEQESKIFSLKGNIIRNDESIRRLLEMVVSSSH